MPLEISDILQFATERKKLYWPRTLYLQRVRDVRDGLWSGTNLSAIGARKSGQSKLKQPGFEFMQSNEPKVLYKAAVRILSSGGLPVYQMPRTIEGDAQAEKYNKAERLSLGIHRDWDRYLRRKGHEGVIGELAHWVCQGWYAGYVFVERDPITKQPQFRLEFYDPIQVYPQFGTNGLTKVVRVYQTEVGALQDWVGQDWLEERGLTDSSQVVEVVNYWEKGLMSAKRSKHFRVTNAIIVNSEWFKPPTIEAVPDIPVIVGAANGYPEREYELSNQRRKSDVDHYTRYQGQSVLDMNLEMYEHLDRALTLIMQRLSKSAYGNTYLHVEDPASLNIAEADLGSGSVVMLKRDDRVTESTVQPVPDTLGVLLDSISTMIQKGSLSPQALGVLPFELSGFALSQVLQTVISFLSSQIGAIQHFLRETMSMTMHQYRYGKFGDVRLDVRSAKGTEVGNYLLEDFSPSDVPDDYFLEVRLPISVVNDKVQRATQARTLMGPPQILSRQTIWEDYLEVQDPELEYVRIVEDGMMETPEFKAHFGAERLREKADDVEKRADEIEAENPDKALLLRRRADVWRLIADRVEERLMLALAQGLATPGTTGAPGAIPGVNPATLPAELGGINPDIMAAIAGAPPTTDAAVKAAQSQVRRAAGLGATRKR